MILLSFVLAVGFLLLILSCALWNNWLPILVGMCLHDDKTSSGSLFSCSSRSISAHLGPALIFFSAPFPNALAAAGVRSSDFSAEYDNSSPIIDFGRFMTSIMVVTGFALPIVLAHAQVIHPVASVMSIAGGGLVYGAITAYSAVFKQDSDEF